MTGQSLYTPNLEDYYIVDANGEKVGNPKGSNATYEAVLINGKYYVTNPSFASYKFFGSSLPKVTGGFGLNVAWKSLQLNTLFTYALGGKVLDEVYRYLMTTPDSPRNLHVDAAKSWTHVPEGMTEDSPDRIDPNGIPMISSANSDYNNAQTSRFFTSGDYLVLKNITLNYILPRQWVKAHLGGINNISVYFTCQNAFSVTARKGLNPQQRLDGLQNSVTVTPRIYTFGLNVKF